MAHLPPQHPQPTARRTVDSTFFQTGELGPGRRGGHTCGQAPQVPQPPPWASPAGGSVGLGVMGPRVVAVPLAASVPGPRSEPALPVPGPGAGTRGLRRLRAHVSLESAADVVTTLWTVPGAPASEGLLRQGGDAATFQVPVKQGLTLCFGAKRPHCPNVSASHTLVGSEPLTGSAARKQESRCSRLSQQRPASARWTLDGSTLGAKGIPAEGPRPGHRRPGASWGDPDGPHLHCDNGAGFLLDASAFPPSTVSRGWGPPRT